MPRDQRTLNVVRVGLAAFTGVDTDWSEHAYNDEQHMQHVMLLYRECVDSPMIVKVVSVY
jgi:hypothetical protein